MTGQGTAPGESEERAGFESWLAMMDYELEMFALEDVPGLASAESSTESLALVERALLARFPSKQDIFRDEESRQFFDRSVRYVGNTMADLFGGAWELFNAGTAENPDLVPVVRFTFRALPVAPFTLITSTISSRHANWSQVIEYLAEDREAFGENGTQQ